VRDIDIDNARQVAPQSISTEADNRYPEKTIDIHRDKLFKLIIVSDPVSEGYSVFLFEPLGNRSRRNLAPESKISRTTGGIQL
jgi:hypothetical protein